MERVGFLGIIKLTTQIILKNFEHFLCLAILWQIPFSFLLPVVDLSSFALRMLRGFLVSFYKLIVSKEQSPSPPALAAPFPSLHRLSLQLIAGVFLSITISHPLLTFSVCRACLSKSLSLKGSLLGVPRSAKNLALTSMCVSMVAFGLLAMMVGMMGIIVGVVVAVRGVNEAATEWLVKFCTLIGMGIGGVYLAISFSLVPTVVILEEKRGWGAMTRSMELVNGRKWQALWLVYLAYAMYELCRFGVLWRWRGASIVRVSLNALVALFSMAAHVVLYVSCKREREEPLNTLIAASAQFGPPQSSPESMDVETAAFLSALPE